MIRKKGQLTIIAIIALAVIGGILIYFAVRSNISESSIPTELSPIFSYYQQCIQDEAEAAVSLAGSQGGHIMADSYEPGSDYAPFSSQLNFLGFPVPYWLYVSGNGIIKEQVPSKKDIESDIDKYIEENLPSCDFEQFYAHGYLIKFEKPEVKSKLDNTKLNVDVNAPLTVSKGDASARKTTHTAVVNTKLGKFYNLALKLYEKEKEEAFLENYSIDVLRLYAPVDGVEISCSPKIWKTREVIAELHEGLEANIASLKFKGRNYGLQSKEEEYFVIDQSIDESVRLFYSRDWPSKVEITGAEDELMIAEPVGNQQGMGIMGFCYAPYHFVYDLSYPIMFQIFDGNELFQFPVVVIIDNNVPREAALSSLIEEDPSIDLCNTATQDVEIEVHDIELNPIDNAEISYNCFNQLCRLGKTNNGLLKAQAPSCLNGYLQVRADSYAEKKQLFSTNKENKADIILDKQYDVNIDLRVGDKPLSSRALVSFIGDRTSSAMLPDVKTIQLSEGQYEVRVYVYGNSSIKIPSSTKRQCTEVPRSGFLGLFGSTKEECFDITIPETTIDYALIGGGTSQAYLLESQLEKGALAIQVEAFPVPSSLEQLQYNFEAFSNQGVDIS